VPESYLREWLVSKRVNRTGEGVDDPERADADQRDVIDWTTLPGRRSFSPPIAAFARIVSEAAPSDLHKTLLRPFVARLAGSSAEKAIEGNFDVASVLSNDSNLVAPIRIGQSGAEQTGRSFVAGKQAQLGTVARGRIHPPPSRQRSCRFAISRFSAPLRRTGLGEAGDLEVAPARHPNVRPSTDQPFRAWAADHELFVIDAEVAKRVIVRVSAMVSRTQGELARNSECYRAIDGA
jgi:hypothetical protein